MFLVKSFTAQDHIGIGQLSSAGLLQTPASGQKAVLQSWAGSQAAGSPVKALALSFLPVMLLGALRATGVSEG